MKRKFFVKLSSGDKFEISELDFNNLKGRQARGQTAGWYAQRGESFGSRHDWVIQFKDIAGFWANAEKIADKEIRNINTEKRLPPEVKSKEEPKPEACGHNWNDESTYGFVTTIVNGVNRYFKSCDVCNAKSTLIKKREVELAMERKGLSLDDVPLVE